MYVKGILAVMILAVSSGENKPEKKFYCSILHLTEQYTGQCPLSVPACATQELKTGAYLHLHKLLTDNCNKESSCQLNSTLITLSIENTQRIQSVPSIAQEELNEILPILFSDIIQKDIY